MHEGGHCSYCTEPITTGGRRANPLASPGNRNDRCSFGRSPVTAVAIDKSEVLDEQQRVFIEIVENVYRDYSALELSSLTHQANTPWDTTRRKYGMGAIIPNELIPEHCRELLGEIGPRPAWITSNATS